MLFFLFTNTFRPTVMMGAVVAVAMLYSFSRSPALCCGVFKNVLFVWQKIIWKMFITSIQENSKSIKKLYWVVCCCFLSSLFPTSAICWLFFCFLLKNDHFPLNYRKWTREKFCNQNYFLELFALCTSCENLFIICGFLVSCEYAFKYVHDYYSNLN